ncbi:ribosomal protection-like ABC-F family protein [Streptomyces sp. CB03238]|uniref:ribosomal protection-like ABC-F family protein n=1 Tax=Streptomyces sp. CB03238 TaxID=1907777 RepID=UPI000A0F4F3F|nr:ABC-F family ATP-binding cassette domain-containing protein [Streptomyces sp. CB03238]ORT61064.1 ABC transporter ATP-binding protein [Streptomyces sp. CB03238]
MRDRAHDPSQLTLKDVSKAYGDRSVLDQVTFTVRPGEKIGVIGENGSGKSTLLRMLAGAEAPDSGEVTVRFSGGVAHLGQTLDLDPAASVQDAVDASLSELRAMERRLRAAEEGLGSASEAELAAYGELLSAYEERGGYQADARVDAALHGLGVGHIGRGRPLGSLSGGEQSRLALACVLASGAELLLLDEPTNHLDRQATGRLEERLRAHRGTVLAVTHDRVFLEAVATAVLEVDRDTRAVTRYGDGWAGYRAAKAAARRRWELDHQAWLDGLAESEALVAAAGQRLAASGKDPREGFGKHRRSHEAKLSGRVRAARQRLERLRREPVAAPPEPLRFAPRLAAPDPQDVAVELDGVVVGDRLRVAGLRVGAGGRLLVTGPNGAGKTTLLRVIAGDLRPDAGTVHRPARVGYLPQELPARPPRRPLLAAFAAGRPDAPEDHAEELLALGLFREEDLPVPVAALSVGQRRRLELARLVTRPAGLLVLDEPTNHVALGLVEELEAALAAYEGAVVVVSHDRRFRSAFAGDRLELRAGRAVRPRVGA